MVKTPKICPKKKSLGISAVEIQNGKICARVHKIKENYSEMREDLRCRIYYNDDGAREKRSGEKMVFLQKRPHKKHHVKRKVGTKL